jgi:hypothetical protein
MADRTFLNFEAASRQLGISSRTLHRWVDRGIVPAVDDGSGRRLVDLEAARVVAARPRTALSTIVGSAPAQITEDATALATVPASPQAGLSENVDTRLAALEERVTVLERVVGVGDTNDVSMTRDTDA